MNLYMQKCIFGPSGLEINFLDSFELAGINFTNQIIKFIIQESVLDITIFNY